MADFLQLFVDWLVYSLVGLDPSSSFAGTLNFFIYDSAKILILLFAMIFVMGFIRTYLPPEKVRAWLTKRKGLGNLFASCFGAITPFCSCSSIPIFLGFLEAKVPLGVAFSFLITSPLVNEYLVILMLGFFGLKITVAYVITGILIGILGGTILGRMNLDKELVKDFIPVKGKCSCSSAPKTRKDRLVFGFNEAKSITKKIWLWVLVGVGIGALIHNYVPPELIQNLISQGGIFSVPIAALAGVPIYGSCVAIVPIAVVLFQKGVPLGTALSFMMASAALSLPEAVILKRAMKLRLILIFFGVVTASIILIGYLFNFLAVMLV